jgi:hypothetical protein
MAEGMDPHTKAALTFAELRRKRWFPKNHPWVRNTVVCVESDLVNDVQERFFQLLPNGGHASVACYFPERKQFVFVPVNVTLDALLETPGLKELFTSDDIPHEHFTMGQAIATADMLRQDWSSLPPEERPVGYESTAEIEKNLALT